MIWEHEAACGPKEVDPELFAPVNRHERKGEIPLRVLRALRYCHGLIEGASGPCPVMAECAKLREENGYTGVWGGKWWPDSKAPTGYANGLLRGGQNARRAS